MKFLFSFLLLFSALYCFGGNASREFRKNADNDTSITCSKTSLNKNILIEGNVFCNDVKHLSNGNTCVVGAFYKYPTLRCAFIAMLDKNYDTLWVNSYAFDFGPDAYMYRTYYDGRFEKVIETSDHNLLIMATDFENLVIKTDLNGNILWFNQFKYNASTLVLFDLIETNDGNFISCGIGDYHSLIVKLDKNGKELWAKNYYLDSYLGLMGVAQYGNSLYAIGKTYDFYGVAQSVFCKIDYTTGDLVWSKGFGKGQPNQDIDIHFCSIKQQEGTPYFIINGVKGSTVYWDNTKPIPLYQMLITADTSGGIKQAIEFKHEMYTLFYDQLFTLPLYNLSSKLMVQASLINPSLGISGQYDDIQLIKLNSKYEPQWAYIESSPARQELQGMDTTLTGDILVTGFSYDYNLPSYYTYGFINKYSSYGIGSCASIPINIQKNEVAFSSEDIAIQSSNAESYIGGSDFPFVQIPSPPITIQNECTSTILYTLSHVRGLNKVCNNTSQQYKAVAHGDKVMKTSFDFDTSYAGISSRTDSTITLHFKRKGSFYLKSGFSTSCGSLKDSLLITISAGATALDLGDDKFLCHNNFDTLYAGNGYLSYTWQDNSHAQNYVAKTAGTYFVSVADACGITHADTVQIQSAKNVQLSLEPFYSKCANDMLSIPVDTTIRHIYFDPVININYSDNTIKATTASNTNYTVKAISSQGCVTTGQFDVIVNQSPVVYLGADTSICEGTNIELSTKSSFANYDWNSGLHTPKNTITEGGTYWVTVKDMNGCIGADTIHITEFKKPDINLGENRKICDGSEYTFSAGDDFASYLWQDNSNNKEFTTKYPGTYWVTVKDIHNCINADTVVITGYNPLPSNFLAAKDSVCLYEPVTVRARGNWASYLWSNGSSRPAIQVNQPGNYMLTVSSFDGCSGTDTIQILQKNCIDGIYFPTAFTPNHDGKNDVFKPIVHVPLEKYFFTVYNRFGKAIYTSSDPSKGWDGKINGYQYANTTFVWYCKYTIKDSKEVIARGTVTAIY